MTKSAVRHDEHPCLSASAYLIFVRLCGWLVLLSRSSASKTSRCTRNLFAIFVRP